MRKFLKNQKGVTMIEVLVTIAILAIVVVPCLSSFVMAQRGNVKAAETEQAYTAAANFMEELKGDPSELEALTPVMKDDVQIATAFSEEIDNYYIVTIYAGVLDDKPASSDIQPILKGVIALD